MQFLGLSSDEKRAGAGDQGSLSLGAAASPFKNALNSTSSTQGSGVGSLPAADVKIGGKSYHFEPNAVGAFPQVSVPANGKIEISVTFPHGEPDEALILQVEDGGQLGGGGVVKRSALDANKTIAFDFTTATAEGIYRVTLKRGFEEQWLRFWVGPEKQLQKGS